MHNKEFEFKIGDGRKCKSIHAGGGGTVAATIGELKAVCLEYFKWNNERRFPPSYYSSQSIEVVQWAKELESCLKEDLKDCRMLVGFDPIKYLQLIGFKKEEINKILDITAATTFDNLVVVLNNKSRWIMVSAVIDKTEQNSIETELKNIDSDLKSIFLINEEVMYLTLVGILVSPKIESFDVLKGSRTKVLYNDQQTMQMFITKSEFESADWSMKLLKSIDATARGLIETNGGIKPDPEMEQMKTATGTMMASMAMAETSFPKLTKDIEEQITTVFLNKLQIEAVQDTAKWKILKGPFGGGKTIVLAEIAKNILQKVIKFSFLGQNHFISFDLFKHFFAITIAMVKCV